MKRKDFMKFLEAFKQLRENIDDETALTIVKFYPTLKGEGQLIKAGSRYNVNGLLYRAIDDLWDITDNHPENAPELWELITEEKEETV